MNLHEALNKGTFILEQRNVENPQLSCELLLAKVVGMARSELLGAADRPLKAEEEGTFKQYLARRAANEPVAYLTESIEFYSINLRITKGVFIPRPETELLVDKALEFLKGFDCPKIWDLCTGCGNIIIALAKNLDDGDFWATDISENAINLTEYNLRKHDLQRDVELRMGNLLQPMRKELVNNFDLIVSNPPYIRSGEIAKLSPQIKDHEPHAALDGGRDGLNVYRNIFDNAAQMLSPRGAILMEIDPTLTKPLLDLLERKQNVFQPPVIYKDLADKDRVLMIRPKASGGFGF